MIQLKSCPKQYNIDVDKTIPPKETLKRVYAKLKNVSLDILAKTQRIDTDRLGIPVFLSMCGHDAKNIIPTRKQMGKGVTPEQAETSALMELMERFSFFSFWEEMPEFVELTWSEAEERFGDALIPVEEIIKSVNDNISVETAKELLDIVKWQFYPSTCLTSNKIIWIPINWFKKLNEFNGTSAGNSEEESLMQGACELIERHVCCFIDGQKLTVPTIDPETIEDETLKNLLFAFEKNKINLWLKDFSLDMPVPTVVAMAWDPSTFPHTSEIVYTAGTASSPTKAAIRAVTEIAQLAGDFCTSSCYEASSLQKFYKLSDTMWLLEGKIVSINSLPSIEDNDFFKELTSLIAKLESMNYNFYAISTMYEKLQINAHYSIIPGLSFRERDKNQSVGLFVGSILIESFNLDMVASGLQALELLCPNATFIPFFKGMHALNLEDVPASIEYFSIAEQLQEEIISKGIATFYLAYAHTAINEWEKAIPILDRAIKLGPDTPAYLNLRGAAYYKTEQYELALTDFIKILALDKGSAINLANIGVCHKFLGNAQEAKHYLKIALKLDSSIDFARTHLDELNNS